KKKNGKKSEASDQSVTSNSDKSSRSNRPFKSHSDDCDCDYADPSTQEFFDKATRIGMKLMTLGKVDDGAEYIAKVVVNIGSSACDHGDAVLSALEENLHPDHFALILQKLLSNTSSDAGEDSQLLALCSLRYINVLNQNEGAKSSNSESNQNSNKKKRKKIERPDSIPGDVWQQFYDLGRHVSDFVLDAFEVYETGDFASWDKNRMKTIVSSIDKKNSLEKRYKRTLVCEFVLVERLKEKDFFCCFFCQETFFHYKQALIHISCDEHEKKDKSCVLEGIRRVLNSFTDLPMKLRQVEIKNAVQITKCKHDLTPDQRPTPEFIANFYRKYISLVCIGEPMLTGDQKAARNVNPLLFEAETLIGRVKSDYGKNAMAELHEHIGNAQTCCRFCMCETGDREGFYNHMLGSLHRVAERHKMKSSTNTIRFCILTILVNVHRKDLI
ncbi:hypothetical protein PMAYCL1PPCAC_25010, partial [Pristionchus mayeri]